MPETIKAQLIDLASEFANQRHSGNRNCFPDTIWLKAIALSKILSISSVCRAINASPAYFRKKISLLEPSNSKITFLEIPTPKYKSSDAVTINVVAPSGHRLTIESANALCLVPFLNEFLKWGS